MPYRKRKERSHILPPWAAEDSLFFITLNARPRGGDQLVTGQTANYLLESFRVYRERGRWFPRLALVMPDHLHAILGFRWEAEDSMERCVRDWKRYVAREKGIDWQRDFFDHRLRGDDDISDKEDYLLDNPVRAGLVARREEWPHVRYYD